MKSAFLLKKEIENRPNGTYAPYYWKYLGYKSELSAPKRAARVNAVKALFTLPEAHIYQNDWIVGSLRPMFCEKSKEELEYAARIDQSFGNRTFSHNSDHFAPDYRNFVKFGIPGVLQNIHNSLQEHTDEDRVSYLHAMEECMLAMRGMILRYADKAKALKDTAGYDNEKLDFIGKNCRTIANSPPQTFAQALQLVWFAHICFNYEGRYAMALGRLDQYLYGFYQSDVQRGLVTDADVLNLLENTFIKLYEPHIYRGGDDVVNICIGGTSPSGECEVNALSYLILQAVNNCKIPGPNLSARIGENVPDRFLDECLKVIGTGLGYPALMNDRVNIAALKRYGYDEEDVYDYSMVGCIENFITGKQPPWSDGRFDTPRFFEFLFNRGRGILNPSCGPDTGDVGSISSMRDFMQRFEEQLRYGADEYYAFFNNENTRLNPKEYEQPFLSCFCENCIERAQDICAGGSKYPSVHGVALMGVGTVCDSLAAVEKVVFIDRQATLEQLREALIHNFEGYEDLRKLLLGAPKYGNGDWFADKYAVWFVDFLSEVFSGYRTYDGGRLYIAMAANISNVYAGKIIAATPDGRKAGEPLSDAASPTYGRDTRGATMTVNSLTKPDYTKVACGTVVNQKFSPSVFEEGKRQKLLALIKTYFQKGGQEMQINATSREVLQDAMLHPENYPNLVVRVSGFSAYYITLDKDVQMDILNRTQK